MDAQLIKQRLAELAPSIAITVIWEHDDCATWDCDAPDLDPNDYTAWQSEVRATAIVDGKEIYGCDFLAGTWEKNGDHPAKSNPEISGYLLCMISDALEDLAFKLPGHAINKEIKAAKDFVSQQMRDDYNEQMNASTPVKLFAPIKTG